MTAPQPISTVVDLVDTEPDALMIFMRSRKNADNCFVAVSKKLSKMQAESLMEPEPNFESKEYRGHDNFWCWKSVAVSRVKSAIVPIALLNGMEFGCKEEYDCFAGGMGKFVLTRKE